METQCFKKSTNNLNTYEIVPGCPVYCQHQTFQDDQNPLPMIKYPKEFSRNKGTTVELYLTMNTINKDINMARALWPVCDCINRVPLYSKGLL